MKLPIQALASEKKPKDEVDDLLHVIEERTPRDQKKRQVQLCDVSDMFRSARTPPVFPGPKHWQEQPH